MTWRLNPSDANSIELAAALPGDFLCSLRARARPDIWVKLGGSDDGLPMLNLTGENAMVVWDVKRQSGLPTLRIARGADLDLEIDDSQSVSSFSANVGDLVIAESGAHFVALRHERGFNEQCCISLRTWQPVGLHEVGNINVSFSTWRLADNRSRNEKQVYLSFGEWK